MITGLQVLAILKKSGKPLSEMASVMHSLPQILINVKVRERVPLDKFPELEQLVADVQQRLGDSGRVLIRYSGTEPLMRIMLEGEDQDEISSMANQIAQLVRETIGESAGE